MAGKRKFSQSGRSAKRSRSAFRRPRGKYGRSFRRKGSRFPTYRFHRYINSVGSYNYPSDYFNEALLPFTWEPKNTTAPNTVTSLPIAFAATINDIASLSEFSSLFDRYMITGVCYYINLVTNPNAEASRGATSNTTNASIYPKLWYAQDYDDNTIATLAQIKEYGNVRCKVLQPNRMTKVFVKYPRVATMNYQSSGTVNPGTVSKPTWMDLGFPNIPHFGCKFVVDFEGCTLGQSFYPLRIKMEAKYYFKCKDVR